MRVAKQFKLQKIASVALTTGESATNAAAVSVPTQLAPRLDSFPEYVAFFKQHLQGSCFALIEEAQYFAIAGFFKNGKQRKSPMASIQFVDRSTQTMLNMDSGELEQVKHELTGRERPWRVDSARLKEGKAFGQLSKAADFFMQEIQAAQSSNNDALHRPNSRPEAN